MNFGAGAPAHEVDAVLPEMSLSIHGVACGIALSPVHSTVCIQIEGTTDEDVAVDFELPLRRSPRIERFAASDADIPRVTLDKELADGTVIVREGVAAE